MRRGPRHWIAKRLAGVGLVGVDHHGDHGEAEVAPPPPPPPPPADPSYTGTRHFEDPAGISDIKLYQQHAAAITEAGGVNDQDGRIGAGVVKNGVPLTGFRAIDYGTVRPGRRLFFAKREIVPKGTGGHTNTAIIKLDPADDGASDPAYFMPWDPRGGVVYMELTDPDRTLFFTSKLTGCSFFVGGPPNAPRVYHAGVSWDISDLPRVGNTTEVWEALVAHIEQTRFGSDVDPTRLPQINKRDYLNRTVLENQGFLRLVSADRNATVLSSGSVFGFRDGDGNWSFYLQEVLTFAWGKPPNQHTETRPGRLLKFFPAPPEELGYTWDW
jgi:hypothetical protein